MRPVQLRKGDGRISAEELAEDLARKPYARLVAMRAGEDTTLLISERGKALVHRLGGSGLGAEDERISYRIIQGSDPLNLGLTALAGKENGQPAQAVLSAGEWLAATMDSPNPGVVSQIVGYFDSTRSGDIVVFAEVGYGFGPDRSGHGSTTPQEMRIPLVFAGPGVRPGVTSQPARLHSLMPTIVTYLGHGQRLRSGLVPEGPVLSLQAQATDTQESSVETRSPR
jgi:hypothetical protein